MLKKRLIACLLLREGLIVQSIGFERYLPLGRPRFPIELVSRWDVDEIVVLDMSATPAGRSFDLEVLELLSTVCFVPLTIGGGIRTVDDVRHVTRAGADKVSIQSAALADPALVTRVADHFGSQCVVVSVDVKRVDGGYEVFGDCGRRETGRDPLDWAREIESRGGGEILLNSIDRDGAKTGYDVELIRSVADAVEIPVIALGGVGRPQDFAAGVLEGNASAVAAANIFHYVEHSTILAKTHLFDAGVDVRLDSVAKYRGREFDADGRLLPLPEERLEQLAPERYAGERL